jgi:hypothetical protein
MGIAAYEIKLKKRMINLEEAKSDKIKGNRKKPLIIPGSPLSAPCPHPSVSSRAPLPYLQPQTPELDCHAH